MTEPNRDIGALIGARICHDLISPVGAISNGLELIEISGVPDGPEMALVAGSAANANARLRFFRIAFGGAGDTQTIPTSEINGILRGVYAGKIACDWQVEEALPRQIAQAAFLALLCAEQATPFGGAMLVSGDQAHLSVTAAGPRLAPQPDHWAWLTDPGACDIAALPAAQVQFALLPDLLGRMGRGAAVRQDAGSITLSF